MFLATSMAGDDEGFAASVENIKYEFSTTGRARARATRCVVLGSRRATCVQRCMIKQECTASILCNHEDIIDSKREMERWMMRDGAKKMRWRNSSNNAVCCFLERDRWMEPANERGVQLLFVSRCSLTRRCVRVRESVYIHHSPVTHWRGIDWEAFEPLEQSSNRASASRGSDCARQCRCHERH